jgi:hypothetical protein
MSRKVLQALALVAWYLLMGAVIAVYAYVAMLLLFRYLGPLPYAATGLAPALAG